MMNILLPTDFSENSKNAVAYALEFFRNTPCTFHLLHVSPPHLETLSQGHHAIPREIREKFDDLLDWVNDKKVNPHHYFSICFKVRYFIEAIREKVAEKNIDLILMGTKGASNQKEIILGKNTSDVVMKVKCPTLAISENAVSSLIRRSCFLQIIRYVTAQKCWKALKILPGYQIPRSRSWNFSLPKMSQMLT